MASSCGGTATQVSTTRFVQPVLARRDDRTVIGGHQRLVVARRLGLDTVPVTWLDITSEQARVLGLALNRISGSWDDQLLAQLLADLQGTAGIDLWRGLSRSEPHRIRARGLPSYSVPN